MGNICPATLSNEVDEVAVLQKAHRDWHHMKDWFVEDDSSTDEEDDGRRMYNPPPFRRRETPLVK